ncbi:MAG: ABC transporter permease [Bryobacteraceae bacterium]
MQILLQEIRYSLRSLRKTSVFTTVAILSLALGVGANTAIFTLMDQLLLRMLPIENPSEIVLLDAPGPAQGSTRNENAFSYPMYTDLKSSNSVFSGMLARFATECSLSSGNQTERVQAELVSGNFFEVLGVRTAIGRTFTPDDDKIPNAHPLVILTDGYWARRFGRDRSVLNRKILVNGHPMTVIGVTAPGFYGIEIGSATDILIPMMMKAQVTPNWDDVKNRQSFWLNIFARLKQGVPAQQAEAAMNVSYRQFLESELKDLKGNELFKNRFVEKHLYLLPGERGRSQLRKRFSTSLVVLMCMVGIVLLIACANVANLLIARAAGRQKEVAIRLALGAARYQIVRQLLIESTLLSLAGGAAGLLFASWTGEVLVRLLPFPGAAGTLSTDPDLRVLGFALALSLLTGLLFGLAPALQSTRPDLAPTLKAESGNSSATGGQVRFRKGLVVAQVALSLLLLIGGGLFAKSLYNLKSLNPGFRTDHIMTFAIDPSLNGYKKPEMLALFENLQDRIGGTAGVRSVSTASLALMTGDSNRSTVRVEGYQPKDDEDMNPYTNEIGTDFFATMGIPLIAGRDFTKADIADAPKVAIINETMGHYFFGNANPLGRRFKFGGGPEGKLDIEIIGVVKDGKIVEYREKNHRLVYLPYRQSKNLDRMTFYVQTTQDPNAMAVVLQKAVHQADPNLPVFQVKNMQAQVDESLFVERIIALLSAFFGLLATLLAAIGLYGVMAYAVARRTREIGIRMALGAERGNVLWLVMREVTLMGGIGIAIGLPIAYLLGRLVESQLFGLSAQDPGILVIATASLALVALLSGYLPAERATRVDPMVALRYE